ncbi:MAG: VTT domain-containing protein [Myxococcota bacterium]
MKTLFLLFVACALSGIAIPLPEDLPLLAAGMTVERADQLVALALAGGLGVLCRDAVFFGLGRAFGEGALRWRLVRRLIGDSRLESARQLVLARGGRAVLAARFLVGFRSAAFLVAGAMGVRVRDFVVWDAVALVVSVPVVLALGAVLGTPLTAAVLWVLDHRLLVLGMVVLVGLAWVTSEQQAHADDLEPAG